MSKLAAFAGIFFHLSTQVDVDDDGLFAQNRTSGDWHWPTYAEVFSECVFPDYSVGLHRPYAAVVLPQGLKTGASTAAAMVDRQCVFDQLNCYVGKSSFGETLRLDQPVVQKLVKKSKGMFGGAYPFDGWTGRSTMNSFIHSAVPSSNEQILTVVRDPAERVIAAWETYRNSRGIFDMDLGDFIELAYYDGDFRLKLESPRFAALDAIARELVGKDIIYGTDDFAKRFGKEVFQKVLGGDWLLMVADRFEESVYMYMKKAYGFDWEDLIHMIPDYKSAEELTSTLTSSQIDMLRELQPYDYILYEAANIVLDMWQYKAENYMEQNVLYFDYEDDDDDYHNDDIYDDDDGDDDYGYTDISCAGVRDYSSYNSYYLSSYYNDDSYNDNYYSSGGHYRLAIESCYLKYANQYIRSMCMEDDDDDAANHDDDDDDDITAAAEVTRKDNSPLTGDHGHLDTAESHVQPEEQAPKSFLATSKNAAAFISNLEKMEEKSAALDEEEETMSSKFKQRFAELSHEAKDGFEARKKQAKTAEVKAREASAKIHKDNLGVSKSYWYDDLDSFEAKVCEFYELNHHSMMSWSQGYRNLKYPESMGHYLDYEVMADYMNN